MFTPFLSVVALLVVSTSGQSPQLSLAPCTGGPSQLFYFNTTNSTYILVSKNACIDILAWGTNPGAEACAFDTQPCHHEDREPSHQNQEFSPPSLTPPGSFLVSPMSGLSLTASSPVNAGSTIALGSGTLFWLNVTSPANGGSGMLVNQATNLCIDAGTQALPGPPAVLRQCSANRAPFQTFDLTAALSTPGGPLKLTSLDMQTNSSLCLQTLDNTDSALLLATPCGSSKDPQLQAFKIDTSAGGHIVGVESGGIVDTLLRSGGGGGSSAYEGLGTTLTPPSSPPTPAATWVISGPPTAATLIHNASSLCLDLGNLPWGHGCLDPQQRSLPYCNPTLPIPARVEDLIGRLTTREKVALTGSGLWTTGESSCDTIDPGVPRLSIPPKQWLVETNSMAASQCYGTACATVFPSAMNLAASGNRTLWREKGRVLSDEMRALNNLAWHRADGGKSYVGLNGFGPDINAPRDPRNGRAGELVSDDPFITSAYAVEFLKGMQEGEDYRYLKMSAGVKHYAGYSMETNRFVSTGDFTLFDLFDTYLPPFEASFSQGKASGSMCSYISLSIDGGAMIPACANKYLLQTLVREYWGAGDAYHTSDCGAVAYMRNKGYTQNDTYSAAAALNGGMDLNSNTILPSQLSLALELGLTNMSTLDASLARTLSLRFSLGQLDPLELQGPYIASKGLNVLGTEDNKGVALEGSAQGLVLAKNALLGGGKKEGAASAATSAATPALPLKRGIKLAVLGPMGAAQEALLGDYYADAVCPGSSSYSNVVGYGCVPILGDAFTAANTGGTTLVFPGVGVKGNDSSWGAAIAAAGEADAVVLALGSDRSVAEEGGDLASIGLPGLQSPFARAVLTAAGVANKPVVLLLVSSFPLAFEELYEDLSAVVLAYNPGMGARNVAEALFGGANRWGRSVYTHYPQAYTGAVALDDFRITPHPPGNPGRTYRYYNGSVGAPTITFGQGLSYHTLSISCDPPTTTTTTTTTTITLSCQVTSTSGPNGDTVLQVFHRASPAIIARVAPLHPVPLLTCVEVQRFTIAAGSTLPVVFTLQEGASLALVNATGARNVYAGVHFLDVWDGSVNNITLPITIAQDYVVNTPPLPQE